MHKFIENLKKQAEDNPMLAMGVGAAFLQAASKFINAGVATRNAKTYKKEIDRRVKKSQR